MASLINDLSKSYSSVSFYVLIKETIGTNFTRQLNPTTSRISMYLRAAKAEAEMFIIKISYECMWGLTAFYRSAWFLYVALVWSSVN